jgi:zona occludens toxin (predicted ATPase)
MAEEIKNNLKNKFEKYSLNFYENLKKYIFEMYECLLLKKEDTNDKNRNLYYSDKLRLKYSTLFLTVISIILHNNLIKNYQEIFDKSFILFLYRLIF